MLSRPGMLFGMPIVSVWYWCIDQEMVQRVLSVNSLEDAQIATATAGFFKILPVFITGKMVKQLKKEAYFLQWLSLHRKTIASVFVCGLQINLFLCC